MKLEKQLNESVIELLSINESVETEASKYFWTLNELGYNPNYGHVLEVLKASSKSGIDKSLMIGLVTSESSFRSDVVHHNGGSNDYGLFQLNNLWHDQHRSNIMSHIKAGVEHYKWCLKAEKGNMKRALSRYNTGGGDSAAGRQYISYVLGNKRKIDRKASQFSIQHGANRTVK
jgi:soluble lytic murein transglycosylase-like protein